MGSVPQLPVISLPSLPETIRRWVEAKAAAEGRDPREIVMEALERQAREDLAAREAEEPWTRRDA